MIVAALGGALVAAGGLARADTCGPADAIDYVLPIDGSAEVHPDALVVVRYTLGAALAGGTEPVLQLDGPEGEVDLTTNWDGRELVATPVQPLAVGAHFTATASRPAAAPWTWTFDTTSSGALASPPVLGPSLEASAEYLGGGPEGDDPCGPLGLERYRVHLALPAAEGSSGPGNLEYVAFETTGPGVTDPVEVGRAVDETASDDVGIDFYLRADGVHGRACFRVLAIDATGVPSGTTDEACTRLAEGPFFKSMCSAIPGTDGSISILLLAAALGIALRAGRSPA